MSNFLKAALLGLLTATLLMISVAGWPWSHDMVTQPAPPPSAGPRPPADGTLTVEGEFPLQRWQIEQLLHNPLPPGAAAGPGRALFGVYCSPCHGVQGSGEGPVAKVFVQPGNLRGMEVQEHNDAWIYGTIRDGANTMPRYGAELTPRQRWEIVRHVRSLKEPSR